MSNRRLDHERLKRRDIGRRGEPIPQRRSLRGWRTEYPTEFPVTTTRKENEMNDQIRPIDGSEHMPDLTDSPAAGPIRNAIDLAMEVGRLQAERDAAVRADTEARNGLTEAVSRLAAVLDEFTAAVHALGER